MREQKDTDYGQFPESLQTAEWKANLIRRELKSWREILGVDVEVLSPPAFLSRQEEDKLRVFGLELRSIPHLDLSLGDLQMLGTEEFLSELAHRYPNWKPFEILTERERGNPSVVRNLEGKFWESVKRNGGLLPLSSGHWLAVETVKKPNFGNRYWETFLMQRMNVLNRFVYDPVRLDIRIQETRSLLLSELSLPENVDIRLLEALEWNLLGNRESWGKTTAYEWTNTVLKDSKGEFYQVIIGGKDMGGVASVAFLPPFERYDMAGFRLAFDLGKCES